MNHECTSCSCPPLSTPYNQSLDELDFERGIWQAAYYGDTSKISSFLNKGTNANIRDASGYTALHYASRNNHLTTVKQLLSAGACVNVLTKCGRDTPLHRAAYMGHEDVVRCLLENGADVMLQNEDGQTALHKAVIGGHVRVVGLLVKAGVEEIKGICDK